MPDSTITSICAIGNVYLFIDRLVSVFQIFVSSTFRDLSEIREAVRETLNLRDSLGVVGMEGFIPSEKTSQETCIRELANCQIYLLLIGYRYGARIRECMIEKSLKSCNKNPGDDCENIISYTRCEYENAVGRGMPRMAIFLDDKTVKSEERADETETKLLKEFKDEIGEIETYKTLKIRKKADKRSIGVEIKGYLGDNIWEWVFDNKLVIPDFYGRHRDLKRLKEQFERHPIICINGVGGIGKSTLVQVFLLLIRFRVENIYLLGKEVARYKSTEEGYKPLKDTFKYSFYGDKLELRDISRLVLGLSESEYINALKTVGKERIIGDVISRIEAERAILVLDDFQDAEKDAEEFVGSCLNRLEAGRVLIVSRDVPGITCGARIPIGGLSEEGFKDYVLKLADDFSLDLGERSAEIAEEVRVVTGCHPLLTRLIIANWDLLGFDGIESLENVVTNVRNENEVNELFSRLCEEILTDEEYRVLQYLSIYRRPFSVESIDLITKYGAKSSKIILNSLITKNMLERVEAGRKLLFSYDPVRDISRIRLERSNDLRRAHLKAAEFHLDLEEAGDRGSAIAEHLYHLAKGGEYELAYNGLIRYFDVLDRGGYWSELIDIYDALLEHYEDESKTCAILKHQIAMIHQDRGEYDEALKLYNENLETFKKLGDRSGISASLHQIANVHFLRGEYDEALKLYNESLEIKEKLGDRSGIAASLAQMALLFEARGMLEEAYDHIKTAHQIFLKLGNKNDIEKSNKILERVKEKVG